MMKCFQQAVGFFAQTITLENSPQQTAIAPKADIDVAIDNKLLLNFLPACGTGISFFYFLSFLFYLGYYKGGMTNLIFSVIYLVTFLFYLMDRVYLGKHFLSWVFIAQVTLQSTYLFPGEAYFQLYLLVAIPLIFILFNRHESFCRYFYSGLIAILLTIIQLRTDDNIRPFMFTENDVELIRNLNLFGSFFVLSIAAYLNIRQSENRIGENHVLAITDALTGLYNQRQLNYLATRLFADYKRNDSPLCVMFIDIDHFKQVNDQYGHDTGDHLLVDIAGAMKLRLRDNDILARIGGDEFILILANTNIDAASKLGEEIRQSISIGVGSHHPFKVGISIGLTQTTTEDKDLETVIKRADHALYSAKDQGRNQLVVET
ncbi:MAG: diguanylate cyclase (GGDEF)-like protein [Gammaproteobacteria bacterium]|jgi:diguanylate cyclase (GGDEF)-like protein